ncbi:Hypothetical protein RAK1035_1352 [Roseovarius sp. AK1035]|nr:Hypothetical protein RAK1035_1352 [Roseovarius sp. AK1035]
MLRFEGGYRQEGCAVNSLRCGMWVGGFLGRSSGRARG